MGYRIILVPTDFSDDAAEACSAAAELAVAFDASVRLLHVYPPVVDLFRTFGMEIPAPPTPEIRRSAAVRLDQELARLHEAGAGGEWLLREGGAPETIVKVAQELPADLIVMGTRGLSGVAHALAGSVAERVARLAPCPVLTVHAPAD